MPTTPVPKQHCGTHATGWLNGKHPKKEEGVVSRKVCFNWSGNTCRWSIYVSVRNCGAFYVYHLGRTPGCSFRYCGNKGHGELSIHAISLKLQKKKHFANIQLSWSIKGLLYGQRGKSRAGKMALSCPLGS